MAANNKKKIEVVLEKADFKKHSVRFETEKDDVDVGNIYVKLRGVSALGNPSAVKVTVEAAETKQQ